MKAQEFVLGIQQEHDEFFPIRPDKTLPKRFVNLLRGPELLAEPIALFAFADDFEFKHDACPFVKTKKRETARKPSPLLMRLIDCGSWSVGSVRQHLIE